MDTILSFSHKRLCLLQIKNKKTIYQDYSALAIICENTQLITCNKPALLKGFTGKQLAHEKNILDILDIFLLLYPKASCAPSVYSIYRYVTKKDPLKQQDHDTKLFEETKLIKELLQEFKQHIKKFSSKEKKILFQY